MKRIAAWLTTVVMVVSFMGTTVSAQEIDYGQRLEELMELIMQDYLYKDDLSKEELFEAAVSGMFGELDQYSDYIPPTDASSFNNRLESTYVGIGIQMIQSDEYIVIDRVFFDGPAEKGGLKVHDKIIGVDGYSLVGKTPQEAASRIMGEKGTAVTLTIDRSGYVFDVELVRDTITLTTVDRLDPKDVYPEMPSASAAKIGYLKIGSFSSGVDEELQVALADFKAEGKRYLLLDLRDNGGGYVTSGVNVLDQLVEAGPVLKFVNNEGRQIVYESELPEADFKIVALINENSASATEFVAAAIQEHGGILVGENTYGKGVAQYLYTLEDGAVVKLTQEEFYSGNDVAIHEVGVAPDIVVEVPDYLTKEVKYHPGDWYDSVADLEKMLQFLGYQVGAIDHIFDEVSVAGLKQFQADQGIYAYGVADFTTQDALNQALIESMMANDVQLKAAMKEILVQINNDKNIRY